MSDEYEGWAEHQIESDVNSKVVFIESSFKNIEEYAEKGVEYIASVILDAKYSHEEDPFRFANRNNDRLMAHPRVIELAALADQFENTLLPAAFSSLVEVMSQPGKYQWEEFNEEHWQENIDMCEYRIQTKIQQKLFSEWYMSYLPEQFHDDVRAVNTALLEQLEAYKNFRENGREAFLAARSQEVFDSVRPREAAQDAPDIHEFVRKVHDAGEHGEIYRITVVSMAGVRTNESGIPLNKYTDIEVITLKSDGNYYMNRASVFNDHIGGGEYGDYDFGGYSEIQMNADYIDHNA